MACSSLQVCVVGEEVRVHERLSLPDLSPELVGSFTFDSQKAYPTLAEVGFLLFVINSAKHTLCRALASSFRTSGSPVVPNEMILENTRAPPYSTPLSRVHHSVTLSFLPTRVHASSRFLLHDMFVAFTHFFSYANRSWSTFVTFASLPSPFHRLQFAPVRPE